MAWCPQSTVFETMTSDQLIHCCIATWMVTSDPLETVGSRVTGHSRMEEQTFAQRALRPTAGRVTQNVCCNDVCPSPISEASSGPEDLPRRVTLPETGSGVLTSATAGLTTRAALSELRASSWPRFYRLAKP